MHRRTLLGAGGALLTSGCLRFIGESESDDGADPDEEGDPDEDGASSDGQAGGTNYPLGVGEDGVSTTLAETHASRLSERTYTLDFEFQDSSRGDAEETTVAMDDERATITKNPGWDESRPIEFYYDGTDGWWRQTQEGDVWYGYIDIRPEGVPYDIKPEPATFALELEAFIRAGSFGPPVEEDDGEQFELTSNSVDDEDALSGPTGFGDYRLGDISATLVATSDGIVRSFEGAFDATSDGEDRLLESELAVTDIGETAVTAPDWAETARDRAPTIRGTLADDERSLTLAHEGGQAVPAGAEIILDRAPGSAEEQWYRDALDTDLTSGESLHVWVADGEIRWSTERAESGDRTLDETWLLEFHLNWADYVSKQIQHF